MLSQTKLTISILSSLFFLQIVMGLTISLLQKFGMPGVQSLSTDRVFSKYLGNNIKDFENFHIAFLNVCNDFNAIMPGRHFKAPPIEEIRACYDKWKLIKDDESKKEERKVLFLDLMASHVTESRSNEGAVVITGMVAPTAAMVLKKSGESVPQIKKFRLHLIPDVVFVPSCTLLALLGVKILQMKTTGTP